MPSVAGAWTICPLCFPPFRKHAPAWTRRAVGKRLIPRSRGRSPIPHLHPLLKLEYPSSRAVPCTLACEGRRGTRSTHTGPLSARPHRRRRRLPRVPAPTGAAHLPLCPGERAGRAALSRCPIQLHPSAVAGQLILLGAKFCRVRSLQQPEEGLKPGLKTGIGTERSSRPPRDENNRPALSPFKVSWGKGWCFWTCSSTGHRAQIALRKRRGAPLAVAHLRR